MSYNGSGTFNINSAGQPVVTGTVISSTAFNALTADLGTGLSTAITKDGQTVATARIPFAAGINSSLVTDATNTTTGSIITAGGVGIAKALFVGTTLNVAGASTLAAITGTFNGTVGATTPAAGAFTTLSATGTSTLAAINASGIFTGTGGANIFTSSNSGAANSLTIKNTSNTSGADAVLKASVNSSAGGDPYLIIDTPAIVGWYVGSDTSNSSRFIIGTDVPGVADKLLITTAGAVSIPGTLAAGATTVTGTLSATTGAAVGGATAGAGGLAFPATAVAVADANTLDDYEEGTWTMGVSFGGGTTGITYNASFVTGSYTKIGNRVFISGVLVLTNKGSASGSALLTGLPFTSSSSGSGASAFSQVLYNATYTGQQFLETSGGTTTAYLWQVSELGVRSALTNTNFANDSQITVGGSYVI